MQEKKTIHTHVVAMVNRWLDQPVILITALLFGMIVTRIFLTYVNPHMQVQAPEYAFADQFVARDWLASVVNPAYRLQHGQPLDPSVGYGYSVPVTIAFLMPLLETARLCTKNDSFHCAEALYPITIILFLIGSSMYSVLLSPKGSSRLVTFIFLAAFLLGIPAAKGMESGNLDILFSCVTAIIIIIARHASRTALSVPSWHIAALGFALGYTANTKIFLLPFAFIPLILFPKRRVFMVAFLGAFLGSSLAPRALGVSTHFLDPFNFALTALKPFADELHLKYSYGNNTLMGISSTLADLIHLPIGWQRITFIDGVSFFIGAGMLLTPIVWYRNQLMKNISNLFTGQTIFWYKIVLLGYAAITIWILIFPVMAYDYRLMYLLPVLIAAVESCTRTAARRAITAAMALLLAKSFWIVSGRIMNIFLYASLFLLWFGLVYNVASKTQKT